MFGSVTPSLSDIAAVTGNQNNGWGNGDGWWVLIILFALFGGWGNGYGAYGADRSTGASGCATAADLQRGFDNQGVTNKLNGLEQGLSQLGYDALSQTNGINQGLCQLGYQTQNSIQQLSSQLADCCCENRAAVAQVRYDMATDTCAITTAIANAARDITDNANANYRALHDELVASQMEAKNDRIAELQSQVQALNLAQSQANQNSYLIGQLRPTPVPAYTVANPYAGFGYGCCAQQCC